VTRFTTSKPTKNKYGSNNGLFHLIHSLGQRIDAEHSSRNEAIIVYLTPSLMRIIGQQVYEKKWASDIKEQLIRQNLHQTTDSHCQRQPAQRVESHIRVRGAAQRRAAAQRQICMLFSITCANTRSEIQNFACAHGFWNRCPTAPALTLTVRSSIPVS
jgi:hypothetical protein